MKFLRGKDISLPCVEKYSAGLISGDFGDFFGIARYFFARYFFSLDFSREKFSFKQIARYFYRQILTPPNISRHTVQKGRFRQVYEFAKWISKISLLRKKQQSCCWVRLQQGGASRASVGRVAPIGWLIGQSRSTQPVTHDIRCGSWVGWPHVHP